MIDWLSDLEAWLIPTFSPQGDGNYLMVMFVLSQLVAGELIPTFSPQGDGNLSYARREERERKVDPCLLRDILEN